MTDLSTKKILFYDMGLFTCIAQKLGESFGKVYYYLPQSDPFPSSYIKDTGEGIEEFERIDDLWKVIDKVDAIIFIDCYDGEFQHWLKSKGYRVFGSGLSERLELDRVYLLECMTKVGLPVPKTYRVKGLEELCSHLKGKTDKWLKRSRYRGDFETYHFQSMAHFKPWCDDLRARIGRKTDNMEILIQNPIVSDCEIGYDGFCIDGKFANKNCLLGYEIKGLGYAGKIFSEPPAIVKIVNDKMFPVFRHHGYNGHFSSEIRITKDGKPFFTDATCRAPSPPAELMVELYKNYADIVWEISGGIVPILKPSAKYGAAINLLSKWYEGHELCVEFPKEISKWVKLRSHTRRNGSNYLISNRNGSKFGTAIGIGNTLKQAEKMCMDIASQVIADGIEYSKDTFSYTDEQIKSGETHGINFA